MTKHRLIVRDVSGGVNYINVENITALLSKRIDFDDDGESEIQLTFYVDKFSLKIVVQDAEFQRICEVLT